MFRETTLKAIDSIFDNEKRHILEEADGAGIAQELFETFVLIASSQAQEYGKLFKTEGFLPKDYIKVVRKLFGAFVHEDIFFKNPHTADGIENLLAEACYLAQNYEEKAPVFVQVKIFVDGQLKEIVYSLASAVFSWTPGRGFSPYDKGLTFKTRAIPMGTNVEVKTKRIPCPLPFLISLVTKVFDDDNWKIEEEDPIEHYEGQVFQWDKAFGELFEVNSGN